MTRVVLATVGALCLGGAIGAAAMLYYVGRGMWR